MKLRIWCFLSYSDVRINSHRPKLESQPSIIKATLARVWHHGHMQGVMLIRGGAHRPPPHQNRQPRETTREAILPLGALGGGLEIASPHSVRML